MKIQPVSNYHFNGLLGKQTKFVTNEVLYGGDYDCDYYEKKYYPFLDESEQEAEINRYAIEKRLNEEEKKRAVYSHSGSYTRVVIEPPLTISREEYKILRKCGVRPNEIIKRYSK